MIVDRWLDDALTIDCSARLVGGVNVLKILKVNPKINKINKNKTKMFKAFWQDLKKEKCRNDFVLKINKNAKTKWAIN